MLLGPHISSPFPRLKVDGKEGFCTGSKYLLWRRQSLLNWRARLEPLLQEEKQRIVLSNKGGI